LTDDPNPLAEKEFDWNAEESFQANPDNVTHTSSHITPQEMQSITTSQSLGYNKETNKKKNQKSSLISTHPVKNQSYRYRAIDLQNL